MGGREEERNWDCSNPRDPAEAKKETVGEIRQL